jgi:hypothetical protein
MDTTHEKHKLKSNTKALIVHTETPKKKNQMPGSHHEAKSYCSEDLMPLNDNPKQNEASDSALPEHWDYQ